MDPSSLDTKVYDSKIEFVAVKEENPEDIVEEDFQEVKEEIIEDVVEENAVYIKTEDEVNADYECPVSEDGKTFSKEADKIDSDVLMCEDIDPLSSVAAVNEDCGNMCSSDGNQVACKEGEEEVACGKEEEKRKRFPCEVCGKKFDFKSMLVRHMTVHTREKSFICEVCSKSFAWKFDLVKHMRVHTNVNPFNCEIRNGPYGISKTQSPFHILAETRQRMWQ
ncbi:zinc finger protein 586 isoform X2 [Penaeus vannamei]|uniref:zinc finger protein 586 isoform X2 n=1 Tax=Penaeus vannamei TaxID=6689 RepID=UPI00387F5879